MSSDTVIKNLLAPASVAMIGVSRKTGIGALNPLQILKNFGYQGKIYPVNPFAQDILGLPCYERVGDIPDTPDLAVISVVRDLVPDILHECADAGIGVAVVISDGFAEADSRGRELQEELTDIHRQTGIRILGPNSMGVVNAFAPFTSSFVELPSHHSPVACVCQSGLFIQGFSGLRIGKGIDIGNGCDIDVPELLAGFLDDKDIRVVVLHIEELKDAEGLAKVLTEKGGQKPIVVFKSGRTGHAREAAISHSGSLVGDYEAYQAFFRGLGLLVVENTVELEDITRLLSTLTLNKGKHVGIITPTGGGGIITLDACEKFGFGVAELSGHTTETISKVFPPYYTPKNPVDIMSAGFRHGYGKVYRDVLTAMLADDSVDILFCISGMPTLKTISSIVSEIPHDQLKPVLSWIIGRYEQEQAEKIIGDLPIVPFCHPERAFRALQLYAQYVDRLSATGKRPSFAHINHKAIEQIIKDTKGKNEHLLFTKALSILDYCGIPIPKMWVSDDLSEIPDTFEKRKRPVCLKMEVEGIVHKSEHGMVKLDIRTKRDLDSVLMEMQNRLSTGQKIKRVLVQEMVTNGLELFVGVKRDPQLGPMLVIGKGGTDVEIYADIAMTAIPLNTSQAIYTLKETSISKFIEGRFYSILADIMVRVSTLTIRFPEIKEMDINPLILNNDGVWAVDARILL